MRPVRCDNCGCAFEPVLQTVRSGELERTFFQCPFCETVYDVAVTDAYLREQIAAGAPREENFKYMKELINDLTKIQAVGPESGEVQSEKKP